jgi:hypothetical protein
VARQIAARAAYALARWPVPCRSGALYAFLMASPPGACRPGAALPGLWVSRKQPHPRNRMALRFSCVVAGAIQWMIASEN